MEKPKQPNNNWTKEETIIAFNVYCKIPFKSSSKTHPTIIKFANILGRTPSAMNMKVGNFGRLDPELRKQGITGLPHGSNLEEVVWNEFHGNWEKLAYESELLVAKFQNKNITETAEIDLTDIPQGKEKEVTIKARVNQSFFRSVVLSSYNQRCCITGLSIPSMLSACHIKPWKTDKENRLNPQNGICLSQIHHTAFDLGFITITPNFKVHVSRYFDEFTDDKMVIKLFKEYHNQSILLPNKFFPNRDFLDWHYQNIFKK